MHMDRQTKSGQYSPRVKEIPKPRETQTPSTKPQSAGASSPPTNPSGNLKPVKASQVAEETMKRTDEYVGEKLTAITETINNFGEAVKKIPENVPVTMPEEISQKLKDFKKDLAELEKKLERVKKIETTINTWLTKGLYFVAGIVTISFFFVQCAANKEADANQRLKDAEKKYQEYQSRINKMDSAQNVQNINAEFGEWMIRRYGEYGSDYSLFNQERNRENCKWWK